MSIKWLRIFKKNLEAAEKANQEYVAKRKQEAKDREAKSNAEMVSKWCPIRDDFCLGKECVHFKQANFSYLDDHPFEGVFGYGAKCKLWGIYGR